MAKVSEPRLARGEAFTDPVPPQRGIKIGATVSERTWKLLRTWQILGTPFGKSIDQAVEFWAKEHAR